MTEQHHNQASWADLWGGTLPCFSIDVLKDCNDAEASARSYLQVPHSFSIGAYSRNVRSRGMSAFMQAELEARAATFCDAVGSGTVGPGADKSMSTLFWIL